MAQQSYLNSVALFLAPAIHKPNHNLRCQPPGPLPPLGRQKINKDAIQITTSDKSTTRKLLPSKSSKSSDGSHLAVRSSNNVKISVRPEVLRSYFPRLYDDHQANPEMEIKLPYSSHALLLIVGFLSRGLFQPTTETAAYNYLEECFHAAQDYGLPSLTTWLRSELSHPRSAYYMGKSPVQAYSICSIYNFKEEKELAFRHCIRIVDLSDSASLNLASTKCQSVTIALDLISRLSRRNTIILEFFSALHMCPLDLRSYYWAGKTDVPKYSDFTCSLCRSNTIFQAPSWIAFWAHCAKMELLKKSGAECAQVFQVEFMSKQRDGAEYFGDEESDEEDRELEPHVCRSCLKKILIKHPTRWEDWAEGVQELLKRRLGDDF